MRNTGVSTGDSLGILRKAVFDADAVQTGKTLVKILDNVIRDPENEKKRRLRLNNRIINARIVTRDGAMQFLAAVGFRQCEGTEADPVVELRGEGTSLTRRLLGARTELVNMLTDLGTKVSTAPIPPPALDKEKLISDAYKTRISRIVPQPRGGLMKSERELRKLKAKEEDIVKAKSKEIRIGPGKRDTIVLRVGEKGEMRVLGSAPTSNSDTFVSESQLIRRAAKKRREEMERKRTFTTRSMRELEAQKRKRVCVQIVLRIQLPCMSIVQTRFRPSETVRAVVSEIKTWMPKYLENIAFELHTSVPRTVITKSMSSKLDTFGLGSAAKIYMKWADASLLPSGSDGALCLRKEMTTSNNDGNSNKVVAFPETFSVVPKQTSKKEALSSNRKAGKNIGNSTKSKKPKWLKL